MSAIKLAEVLPESSGNDEFMEMPIALDAGVTPTDGSGLALGGVNHSGFCRDPLSVNQLIARLPLGIVESLVFDWRHHSN
jgi:hypothetical protein